VDEERSRLGCRSEHPRVHPPQYPERGNECMLCCYGGRAEHRHERAQQTV